MTGIIHLPAEGVGGELPTAIVIQSGSAIINGERFELKVDHAETITCSMCGTSTPLLEYGYTPFGWDAYTDPDGEWLIGYLCPPCGKHYRTNDEE